MEVNIERIIMVKFVVEILILCLPPTNFSVGWQLLKVKTDILNQQPLSSEELAADLHGRDRSLQACT
ncbi:hypothetical protein [Chamaesiphon sp. VAR_48_metabat_403]|uniref:hypothetical protein n=1 Tax=Chamaesiphon sp. VAR_48_metabat_403 TaxID=2964700 RepID=UPI00286DAAFF|nr:hypothetical protein [Chamaesiphon sp. VAR_48_metabat_403]